ncbi:MAG TPA: hypothetical protein VK007_02935, partial [Acidimicrobiales bacterium]|nr:hypothetical protein [Acidimicrobiales bacterium]
MLIALLLLHAVLGGVVLAAARPLRRVAMLLGGLAPLAVVAWAITSAGGILDGRPVTSSHEWMPSLGV